MRHHHSTRFVRPSVHTNADDLVKTLYVKEMSIAQLCVSGDTVQVSIIIRERKPSIKNQPSPA
jgi:hypothetical protein